MSQSEGKLRKERKSMAVAKQWKVLERLWWKTRRRPAKEGKKRWASKREKKNPKSKGDDQNGNRKGVK